MRWIRLMGGGRVGSATNFSEQKRFPCMQHDFPCFPLLQQPQSNGSQENGSEGASGSSPPKTNMMSPQNKLLSTSSSFSSLSSSTVCALGATLGVAVSVLKSS